MIALDFDGAKVSKQLGILAKMSGLTVRDVAYDQMRNGRQYCDLVAVLKAGEKVRFIEHARMGVKVVKTLLTDENGIPQLVDGDVPEPAMMQALAEVAAATK